MKKYFENLVEKIVRKAIIENIHIAGIKAKEEAFHGIFAYIGVERLKKLTEKAEKSGNIYINLAELYSQTIRDNLSKENSEIIHAYFELVPKLNEYKKGIDKQVNI